MAILNASTRILRELIRNQDVSVSPGPPDQSFFFFFVFLLFLWAAPAAYGGSQARGLIGAVATGLRQSHSNAVSEPRLQPTPQLTATPDR